MSESNWNNLGPLDALAADGRQVVKIDRRQIAIFETGKGLMACANRCPHEGYPLVEGTFSGACTLVCNWHGWAFDLEKGETTTGGDRLRTYPVERRDGDIWIDLKDPPQAERIAYALAEVTDAVRRNEYDRIARGLARLEHAGGDLNDAVIAGIIWTYARLEYGAAHAWPATADWLTLADGMAADDPDRLVPYLEALGHMAYDALRGGDYPYTTAITSFDPEGLIEALEAQDEEAAVRHLNGAFAAGKTFADILPLLRRAALMHYTGFGHALIYVTKCAELVDRLGEAVAKPLVLSLARYLVNASRDDLIPEFKSYAAACDALRSAPGDADPVATDFVGKSVTDALDLAVASASDRDALFNALLDASGRMMLAFDEDLTDRVDQPISRNVGWLDFTHAVTFANAVRSATASDPDLWPEGLAQMACFIGRNARFINGDADSVPDVGDRDRFFARLTDHLMDHGEGDPIYSSHMLKLTTAVKREAADTPNEETRKVLYAALDRFMNGRLKRQHVRRTMRQAAALVARED